MLKVDLYTKFVLSVIALSLVVLAFGNNFVSKAIAEDPSRVVIVGYSNTMNPIPIQKCIREGSGSQALWNCGIK